MIEIIYRYDPDNPKHDREAATPAEARAILEEGNLEFSEAAGHFDPVAGAQRIIEVSAEDIGLGGADGVKHQPFAIVVGCADARAPIELIFGQGANDLFVLRVAGNVLGSEVLGSIDYALAHLAKSIRLVVVLGHSGCGAVEAATDAFLDPAYYLALAAEHHLRTIVNQVLPAVRLAERALVQVHGRGVRELPGFRAALLDSSVVINSGMVAATLANHVRTNATTGVGVVYAIYDLASRAVGIPGIGEGGSFRHGLVFPPTSGETFAEQAAMYAASPRIGELLAQSAQTQKH